MKSINGRIQGAYYYAEDAGPDPIRFVLKKLCGKAPPKFVKGYHTPKEEDLHSKLVDWIGSHSVIGWSTNIAIVDAANLIVQDAVSNGNIEPPEFWTAEEYKNLRFEMDERVARAKKAKARRKAVKIK